MRKNDKEEVEHPWNVKRCVVRGFPTHNGCTLKCSFKILFVIWLCFKLSDKDIY